MDKNALRRLAGINTISEAANLLEKQNWSADVKPKVDIPEGLFTKKASTIVKTLIDLHGGDKGKASQSLTFYINRAGDKVSNKVELDAAKDKLKKMMTTESLNLVRVRAGLAVVESEEESEEESSEEEVPTEESKEPSHEEIVAAVAEKAEGKTGEELIAIIKDVYDAGFKDGKESMEEKEEEVKESLNQLSEQEVDSILKSATKEELEEAVRAFGFGKPMGHGAIVDDGSTNPRRPKNQEERNQLAKQVKALRSATRNDPKGKPLERRGDETAGAFMKRQQIHKDAHDWIRQGPQSVNHKNFQQGGNTFARKDEK